MDTAKSLLETNPYPKWTTDASFDEVCDVAGRSFAGSENSPEEPIISFIFRGIFPKQGHAERKDAYKFLESFVINDNYRRGAIHFGHPNDEVIGEPHETSKNGGEPSLRSCVVIREVDPAVEFFNGPRRWDAFLSNFMCFWLYMTARFKGTLPSTFSDPAIMKLVEERGDAFNKVFKNCYKLYGPREKHIYIDVVATDPAYQGRGYGKQLMTQISEIADAAGQACYLECGSDRNRSFYEKFGYKVVHQELLKGDDGAELLSYMMVRPAKV